MYFETLETRLQLSAVGNAPYPLKELAGSSALGALVKPNSATPATNIDFVLQGIRHDYVQGDGISFDVNVINDSRNPVVAAGLIVKLIPTTATEPVAQVALLLGTLDASSTTQVHVEDFGVEHTTGGSYRVLSQVVSLTADGQSLFLHDTATSRSFTLSSPDEHRDQQLAREQEQRYLESRVAAYAMGGSDSEAMPWLQSARSDLQRSRCRTGHARSAVSTTRRSWRRDAPVADWTDIP